MCFFCGSFAWFKKKRKIYTPRIEPHFILPPKYEIYHRHFVSKLISSLPNGYTRLQDHTKFCTRLISERASAEKDDQGSWHTGWCREVHRLVLCTEVFHLWLWSLTTVSSRTDIAVQYAPLCPSPLFWACPHKLLQGAFTQYTYNQAHPHNHTLRITPQNGLTSA